MNVFLFSRKLSIIVQKFSKCLKNGNDRLRKGKLRLRYPDKLVQSTIRQFVASKVSEESQTQQVPDNNEAPTSIVLPFKDQKSADAFHR